MLSPHPPSLLALNEPEASIHLDLIGALARLIVRASRDSQVWITTHSQPLAEAIRRESGILVGGAATSPRERRPRPQRGGPQE